LGACHIAAEILDRLDRKLQLQFWGTSEKIKNMRLLRIAALLHDVGHYPFSHTMEHAIEQYYYEAWTHGGNSDISTFKKPLDHELVGKRIIEHDPEISTLLNNEGIDAKELSAIFRKEEGREAKLTNLVSADLDVDRLDYLQRTAHHTSLPYGNVDTRYLLSQVRIDNEFRMAISSKALRTAEHLLLGRYFDYMQVSFHKTVAAIEWLLSDVIHGLLAENLTKCSQQDVISLIESGEWSQFDDTQLLNTIRIYEQSTADPIGKHKAHCLLNRKIPCLIAELEIVENRGYEDQFDDFKSTVEKRVAHWANEAGIDIKYWHVWHKKRSLTGVGSNTKDDPEFEEKAEKAVRIMDSESQVSFPITDYRPSLMRILGNYELFALRVYVLIDELDDLKRQIRKELKRKIYEDFEDAAWK